MRRLVILLMLLALCVSSPAQRRSNQRRQTTQRERLQADREKVKREREANQRRKRELEQRVQQNMKEVEALGQEIDDKRQLVDSIRQSITVLNGEIAVLDSQLVVLQQELEDRRQQYVKSVRYMYRNRRAQNQMMFVLSAQNVNQMYRRMRFMKEYTTYQKAQGEAVKQKREQVDQKHAELVAAREHMDSLLAQGQHQQRLLEDKQTAQQQLINQLQKEKQTVQQLITQQQKQEAELNARIDKLIAEEIERQRRAEEERQRRLAEQRRREEEAAAAAAAANNNNNNRRNSNRRNNNNNRNTTETATAAYSPAAADQQLSGNFASNKGRLPVPITGSYRVIRGFGPYTLEGVSLNSKGIHLQGQPGAQARCVFDGEVSKVYSTGNSYIVMVRHGRYISVYCNLSAVSVSAGQKVKTNQILGNVGNDHILQFRLQNWTELLNPKSWLSRLR